MESSTSQPKQPVPTLTRENHELWFRQMKRWIESKELGWVVFEEDQVETPQSDTATSTLSGLEHSRHGPKYRKDNQSALYWIGLCISYEDEEFTSEHESARDVWRTLERRYQKKLQVTARQYQAQYNTYQMEDSESIQSAWSHLTSLSRRITAIDPGSKGQFTPNRRVQQLLGALPTKFSGIRDAIDTQGKTDHEEILQLLQERESMMENSETAMFAARGHQSSGIPSKCQLCDGTHWMKDCPGLSAARQAAKSKVPISNRIEKKRTSPQRCRRRSSPDKEDLRSMVKKLSLEMAEMKKSLEKQTKKKAYYKAHAAEEALSKSPSPELRGPSEDEEVETAGPAADAKGKLPPTQWLLDSGASTHMTDQLSLFRGPLTKIMRRWIKVGGGFLWSDHVGRAVVQDQFGNEIVLNTLHVPKLGVNLISGDKLSKDFSLKGLLEHPSFTFVDENWKPVLETQLRRGVYTVRRILGQLERTQKDGSFDAGPQVQKALEAREAKEDEFPVLSDKKKQEYTLMHRRFGHFGAETIRMIPKVTNMSKPIPIAQDKECPCEVCSLTKIKHQRGKPTKRKPQVLALVSVDICGPLDKSLNGEFYFLHIVDNYSRKWWIYPMKSRDQAPEFLNQWKLKVELETQQKLQAVRSDNAPELLKLLKQWERSNGVALNPTEAYNSLQNGVAERAIQTAENDMRALLKDSGLPNEFWPEAVSTSAYLRSRTASGPEVDGVTISPEEAYSGEKPSCDHIKVWGCKVYSYLNPKSLPQGGRQDKLMDRGRVGVFLGYVEGTDKQFWIWAPDMKAKIKASDVRFCEHEKGGMIDLGVPISTTSNAAPSRRPVGRPPRQVEEEVQPLRRVLSHVQIPVQRPEGTGHQDQKEMEGDSTSQDAGQTQSGAKRSREEDEDQDPDEPESKVLRAMFSQLGNFEDSDDFEPIDWALAATDRIVEEVPIPQTYQEAVSDPEWGHLWIEAVRKELES